MKLSRKEIKNIRIIKQEAKLYLFRDDIIMLEIPKNMVGEDRMIQSWNRV